MLWILGCNGDVWAHSYPVVGGDHGANTDQNIRAWDSRGGRYAPHFFLNVSQRCSLDLFHTNATAVHNAYTQRSPKKKTAWGFITRAHATLEPTSFVPQILDFLNVATDERVHLVECSALKKFFGCKTVLVPRGTIFQVPCIRHE